MISNVQRVLVENGKSNGNVIIIICFFGLVAVISVVALFWKQIRKILCQSLIDDDDDVEAASSSETQTQRENAERRSIARLNRRIERRTQLEERQRQSKQEQKRQERREVYQVFLKPFTMIAKAEDFKEVPSELASPKPISNRSIGRLMNASLKSMRRLSTTSAGNRSIGRQSVGSNRSIGQTLHLQLPAAACKCDDADSSRVVPAFCAICLTEYEVNDAIVWASETPCPHVFHQDCILGWLSTGKKRCPVCRNWFVPKITYEELRKQLPPADVHAADECANEAVSSDAPRTEERAVPMGSVNEERSASGVDERVGNDNEESISPMSAQEVDDDVA